MSSFNPGTTFFRRALLLESVGNLIGGIGLLAFPEQILPMMVKPSSPVTNLSVDFAQWLGGLSLALATPLLLGYPNTAAGVASRHAAYWTLGSGELALVAIMAGQFLSDKSALAPGFLLGGIGALGSALVFRAYCMFVNPELMGFVHEEKKRL